MHVSCNANFQVYTIIFLNICSYILRLVVAAQRRVVRLQLFFFILCYTRSQLIVQRGRDQQKDIIKDRHNHKVERCTKESKTARKTGLDGTAALSMATRQRSFQMD